MLDFDEALIIGPPTKCLIDALTGKVKKARRSMSGNPTKTQ
jgi:hypothetical protein